MSLFKGYIIAWVKMIKKENFMGNYGLKAADALAQFDVHVTTEFLSVEKQLRVNNSDVKYGSFMLMPGLQKHIPTMKR
jgi:hypothetical protein